MKKILSVLLIAISVLSLAACSSKTKEPEKVEVSLAEVHQAVKDIYGENYIPSMELDAAALENLMNLKADMYEEVIAEVPMMSAHVDTFVAVKAAEGQADAVEESLNGYRDYLINDAFMYPTNMVKVQASKVVRHGDYVFFVLLGNVPMEVEEQGDDAILKTMQEEVQKGVNAIDGFFNK